MEAAKNAEEHSSMESSPAAPDSPASGEKTRMVLDAGHGRSKSLGFAEILEKMKDAHKGVIDTTAPIDSVKAAVSKFGGVVGWKARRLVPLEKQADPQSEIEKLQEEIPKYKKQSEDAQAAKTQVLEELDNTNKLIEELKDSLAKSKTEEELAQLEVVKAKHMEAINELKSVKEELTALQEEYGRLIAERDLGIARAEEAQSAADDANKKADDLSLELIAMKEALESAHTSHLEEEHCKIGINLEMDKDTVAFETELRQAEEELIQLSDQQSPINDLKLKLEAANSVLAKLKTELETKRTEDSIQSEIEEVKTSIEKAKDKVNSFREAASSRKVVLEQESETIASLKETEEPTSASVSSLEAELSKMQLELELVLTKVKEAREKVEDLPKMLQQANQDADKAKSLAHLAHEELIKAKEEAKKAKDDAKAMEMRLLAALKEIEAAKFLEALAVAAAKAMQDTPEGGVSLQLEEYYTLAKKANNVEELTNQKVKSAVDQIKEAKNSETASLIKLEEACKELEEKKAELKSALEMEQKVNEGKSAAEQEWRELREESNHRRRSSNAAATHNGMNDGQNRGGRMRTNSMSCPDIYGDDMANESKPTKKKSFFPRVSMFLAKKKAQSLK